ncbi:MAG TPA: hypothetical protein ENK18_26310 [Deltaproteobacteria bacterium]|nr:hypothetical protein [Deltaproteobacteria bacterium]
MIGGFFLGLLSSWIWRAAGGRAWGPRTVRVIFSLVALGWVALALLDGIEIPIGSVALQLGDTQLWDLPAELCTYAVGLSWGRSLVSRYAQAPESLEPSHDGLGWLLTGQRLGPLIAAVVCAALVWAPSAISWSDGGRSIELTLLAGSLLTALAVVGARAVSTPLEVELRVRGGDVQVTSGGQRRRLPLHDLQVERGEDLLGGAQLRLSRRGEVIRVPVAGHPPQEVAWSVRTLRELAHNEPERVTPAIPRALEQVARRVSVQVPEG